MAEARPDEEHAPPPPPSRLNPRVGASLLVIAGLAALSYAWAIDQAPLEPYYAAGVRSMSMSWHNFFFGAFDPAGTVTLDKLPGAFWVQALFVDIFGFHTWSMVLPQVVEGVLAVLVLYRAVSRVMGQAAGLVAALVLAASPATVALDRGNISDSAMTLLLVLAANSVSAALETGNWWRLVAAGAWVGLAFQTKMIEAWAVLPALGLAYLLGGPGSTSRRLRQLIAGGLVAAVVSLAWMTVVAVIPHPDRPYVDGSSNDSIYAQVFVYNGFGRFGQETPLQLLAGQGLGLGLATSPSPGPARLLDGSLGRDTGWLLPAGLAVGLIGLFGRRRSYYVLWGGWLLTLTVIFSFTSTINSYYTAALSPPVAALLGAGAVEVWQSRGRADHRRLLSLTAVVVAGTVGYSAWLAARSPVVPGAWVWVGAAVAGAGAVLAMGLALSTWKRGPARLVVAIALAAGSVLFVPAVASAQLVADQRGAFDTPFESAGVARAINQIFVKTPALAASSIPGLELDQVGAPWLLATQTSAVASVFISSSGREVLPIGGFTGTIPAPTLGQIEADVAAGRFHLVLAAAASRDPRLEWLESHCPQVGKPIGALHAYFCTAADAASG